ncbi:Superoxide dismutase [Mn], mitochondrial [Pichia californica]|nr:Superoxide dismutase [Mn], mitochondrial [[Candida] californica]
MVWSQIDTSKAHVAYAVVAVFSTIFSLCSLFVKEKLYLGEATVATIYGLIVGPHCLNWFNPLSWGNYFYITLEISRVLLCIEIVAVSVELPKKYVLKHWFPLFLLLIPCMTAGWLIIGVFIYLIIPGLNFSHGLLISACITATDPILAQAVVGKGKFAKRVPAHLRNLLSAESACNDGVSVPFVYLALNIILHGGKTNEIAKDWICVTVLYECGFGCIMGSLIGYLGRKLLKFAENNDLIDHESFLAFYIMLALLCAGFGSILGVDDLLASFCAGTAFAWDGWFTVRTEESNVSTVIDILLNMAYFVYFGAIIPWAEFNDTELGLNCWRLICVALVVICLRRIPAVMITKVINPDIKNWKEALFVGHFGPIGVGAVFAAIIAVSDLEADVLKITHGPSTNYPEDSEYYQLIRIVWPTVCFLIVTSIIVHGSSVAVMTLGKQLQSMTFTMTWTKLETGASGGPGGENVNSNWFNRLPKIERSGTSFSLKRIDTVQNSDYYNINEPQNSSTEEISEDKINARANANIGMERFNTLENIPTIGSAGNKPVRPIGGANRKKKRRLLKRKQIQKRKLPPVAETLDLKNVNRHNNLNNNNNNNTTPPDIIEEKESNQSDKSNQSNQSNKIEDNDNEHEKLTIPLQKIISNATNVSSGSENSLASGSSTSSIRSGQYRGMVHASPEALRKIQTNFNLKEDDLQPVYEDGELRIPTHAYNYNRNLVIEDQHGEVLRTVPSRNTVGSDSPPESVRSRSGTIRSRAGTVVKNLASSIGLVSSPITDSSENNKNIEEMLNDDKIDNNNSNEKIESSISPISKSQIQSNSLDSSPQRVVKRSTTTDTTKSKFDKFVDLSDGVLFKNSVPRKTRKLHGYRVGDDVIIENEDGEILGRYKVNIKKQKAEELSKGISEEQYNNGLVSKTLKYFGLKKEKEIIDEEMNQISNSEIIPNIDNDMNDMGIEDKIKHLIKANPKQAVVVLPKTSSNINGNNRRHSTIHHHSRSSPIQTPTIHEHQSQFQIPHSKEAKSSRHSRKETSEKNKLPSVLIHDSDSDYDTDSGSESESDSNSNEEYDYEDDEDDDQGYEDDDEEEDDDDEDNITLDEHGNVRIRTNSHNRSGYSVYDETEFERARRNAALSKSDRLSDDEEEDK